MILVIGVALRNVRASVAPICVLLLGTLFTALPLAALGQTLNLFSLAGLAIAIGEMADATIVIVENCTSQLAQRGAVSGARKDGDDHPRHRDDDQAAPLLDAHHRDVVSPDLLPGRARRTTVQPAGLQQDVCDGVLDPADAVPAAGRDRLGVQARRGAARRAGERVRARLPRRAAVDDSTPLRLRRRERRDPGRRDDGHAPVPEGLHAGDGRGLHSLHADDAAWPALARSGVDCPADGPQAEDLPRGGARVRQARTRGTRPPIPRPSRWSRPP